MRNWSIKSKLITSFAAILVFINILGFYALHSMSVIDTMVDDIAGSCMESILDAQKMNIHATSARSREMDIMVQLDRSKMAREQDLRATDKKEMDERIENYFITIDEAFYSDDEEKQADLDVINNVKSSWEDYLAASDKVIALKMAGNTDQARAILDGESLEKYSALLKAIDEISAFNVTAAEDSARISKEAYNQSTFLSIIIQIITLILTIIVCYILFKSIRTPIEELSRVSSAIGAGDLRESAKVFAEDELGKLSQEYNNTIAQMRNLIMQIQHTAQQLAASSQQLSASSELSSKTTQSITENAANVSQKVNQQISQINSMKKVVEEVSGEISETAQIAGFSAKNANSAAQKTEDGLQLIKQATGQMSQIEGSMNQTVQVVETLGEHSKEIGTIVETISAISNQTNLLALNAAIEAARAGEHGRGFSVVADEVRKLAEQSQESTEKIASLIQIIQKQTQEAVQAMNLSASEVERGSKAVEQSGTAFNELAGIAGNIGAQVRDIDSKMNIVLGKTTNIMNVVDELKEAGEASHKDSQMAAESLEEQSASIEEIAAASQALSHLAEEMQNITQRFKV